MQRRTFTALGAAAVVAGALPAPAFAQQQAAETYTWKNAVVNGGGFVPGIVFNETEPNLIYARTDIGGCYRWQEATRTWKPLLDWVGRDKWGWSGVVSMATDPVDPNRVYAAVGTYTTDWDPGNGAILYSDDRGETWGAAELPFKQGGNMPGRGMGERLAVHPGKNYELYLGTPSGNGLWRSHNFGRSWAKVGNFPNPGNFVVDPNNPYSADNQGVLWIEFDQIGGNIYVGVADPDDPLYVSRDGGATWQPVQGAAAALGRADGNRTIPKQAAVDNTNGHLYIITSYDPGPYNGGPASGRGGRLQRLATQTGVWTDVTPPYNPSRAIPGFGGITVDRQNPGTLMASTCNNWGPDEILFRSTDSGATWQTSWDYSDDAGRVDRFTMDNSGSPWLSWNGQNEGDTYAVKHGWMIEALAIDPHDSDRIMWGTGATIWGTDNLTQWDSQGELVSRDASGRRLARSIQKFTVGVRAEGVEETAVLDIAALGGTLVSAFGDIGGFVHTDLGRAEPMIRSDWSTGTSVDFAHWNPNVIVGTGNPHDNGVGHVGVSTDRGRTWRAASPLAGVPGGGHAGVVAIAANASVILWSPSDTSVTPVRSTDLGATWSPVQGLPAGAKIRGDRVDSPIWYAFSGGRFYRSTNGGATFTDTGASGLPTAGVDDFRVVPGHWGHIWLAGRGDEKLGIGGGMWRSQNGGVTWTRISAIETALSVGFGKAAAGSNYPALYTSAEIAGKAAIYRSTDAGGSWQRVNDDAHQWAFAGSAITGDPLIYGRVYLTTNGRGLIYGDIA
ncbi:WD40/YVTN/BNR-like repeat-containing protein [Glycomyces niveus]|uniref:Xyloglucanase n=1 Tax=Glycomyces niveus TaxID=2820287 RepID=A0ABS3UAQ4_9ACTN|nr:xyloglucanase [Glycomyces sp. NEAU-S30]MBO3735865.1 xyloglucanase [Glycomyces sp. NEAU-S30]